MKKILFLLLIVGFINTGCKRYDTHIKHCGEIVTGKMYELNLRSRANFLYVKHRGVDSFKIYLLPSSQLTYDQYRSGMRVQCK